MMLGSHPLIPTEFPLKMRLPLAFLVSCVILLASVSGQVSNSQIDAVFDSLKSTNAPGAAVLVVSNGKPVFRRGYGVTDLRTRTLINPVTDFRLASFTKQFTATCIMLLVHDGKLHYDDHLTDIFPEFPAYGNPITIRNLLNHTSGLPDYEDILMKQYPILRKKKFRRFSTRESSNCWSSKPAA